MGKTYLGESLGSIGKRRAWRSLGPGDIDVPEAPEDAGCEVSPSCLDCPLPQCKYDDPTWYMRQVRDKYDCNIVSVFESFWGLPHEERVQRTAKKMDITTTLVVRALNRAMRRGVLLYPIVRASPPVSHS